MFLRIKQKWRRHSNPSGNCVEVASGELDGGLPVVVARDSKDVSGDWLLVAPPDWQAFTERIKSDG